MSKHKKECLVQLTFKYWAFIGLNGGLLLFSPYILSLSGLNYCLGINTIFMLITSKFTSSNHSLP